MTIKPKATKYRIRRPAHATKASATAPQAPQTPVAGATDRSAPPLPSDQTSGEMLFAPHDDGFGDTRFGDAAKPDATPDRSSGDPAVETAEDQVAHDEAIAQIRDEGLTARQLRLARRLAQKNGLEASSDLEAVLVLRRHGIDPLDRANILAMVTPAAGASRALTRTDAPNSLQKTPQSDNMPSTHVLDDNQRASEILKIQQDIARRRRRKLSLLATRLAFFVLLPTIIAAYYYFAMATPMYATKTEFVIQKADGAGGGGVSSLFSGTGLANNQDSVTVQSFLQSLEAFLRLDREEGYKAHFQQDWIDPLQRLPDPSSNSEGYKSYRNNVKIGYDPSEGIIKMEVIAADPDTSARFARALISYAEEQVDQLTSRLREDQMQGARESFSDAENKVRAAQQKVLALQQNQGVLDPISENSLVMNQVAALETQLQQKRLELGQLLDNPSPNMARVDGTKGDISRLSAMIQTMRSQLTQPSSNATSLAAVTGDLRIAESELETRQLLLSQAAQQMETARVEANKQVRYLEMGVRPIAPDEASYPRAFENTVVAFLIFMGIYLMLSLTASILREQVSS
ncbi:capsule biosynthesis protein [Rhodobacteraceae bacterium]|nr:capsule biosynthesis protein [Paracoccaceae bacterium]